jgi:hypothetical protein
MRLRDIWHRFIAPPAEKDRHPFAAIVPLPAWCFRVITWVAVAVPFIVYWWHLLRYAPNTPFQDDFGVALSAVNHFLDANGIWAKLKSIYERHNDHRLIMVKLAAIAQYGLLGHVNFRLFMILGSLGWTSALLLLMARAKKDLGLGLPFLVPLPYIWFSFSQEFTMFFGGASFQHHWAMFLSLLTFSLLARERTGWATAVASLAACTSGAARVLAPLGSCVLLVRRRWKALLIFVAVTGAAGAFVHVSYSDVLYHSSARDALANFEGVVAFFLRVSGSLVRHPDVEVPLGVLCWVGLLYYVITRPDAPFFRFVATFVFASAAALALVRTPFGEVPIASRYTIYSLLAWVVLCVFVVSGERSKPHSALVLLTAWLVAGTYFGGIVLKIDLNQTFARNYAARVACLASLVPGRTTAGLSVIQPAPGYAEEVLLKSRDMGVFDYTKANRLLNATAVRIEDLQPNREFRGYVDGFDGQHITGWAALEGIRSSDTRICTLLEDRGWAYRIPSFPMKRGDVSQAWGTSFGYDWSGFESFFAAYDLPSGDYRVGILLEFSGGASLRWTDLHYKVGTP